MSEARPWLNEKGTFHIKPEDVARGNQVRRNTLTLKERKALAEYIRTGNKSAAYKSAYRFNPKTVTIAANFLFKKPKMINALEKALKDHHLDDQYAVKTLKDIIDGGMTNIDITRPDTSLKALETYFKITNKMGGGNKTTVKLDLDAQARKMDTTELLQAMRELDKKFKRLKEIMGGSSAPPTGGRRIEEAEVVE